MHNFEVVSSELLLDSPIIAVRRDGVVMPGGGVANREIVEHFGAVAILAFDGEKIPMVRQYRHCVKQRLWELPAGILDVADEDPLECARRELQEETGLAAQNWSLIVDLVSSPGFCEESIRVFLATELSEIEQPEPEDEEADMQLEWFTVDEAVNMVLRGEIVNGIAIAAIMTGARLIEKGLNGRSTDEPFALRPTAMAERRKAAGLHADMKRI
ncbi:NUDIX hydrolase [Corynebacterium sp. H130]|uniref:NUDIX hydrolase n=1 Tax=Corynebacterium sp. H130 TaxID=3133444 RepID=UPI003097B705